MDYPPPFSKANIDFFSSYSFTKLVKKPSQGMGFGGRIVLPKSSFAAAERILYRKEGEKKENGGKESYVVTSGKTYEVRRRLT